MGCRFAGDIDSLDKFWNFILAGSETVQEVPAERWEPYLAKSPAHAATLRRTTRLGGFLTDVAGFDAEFFGISPREAEQMDPQQRIVLEVTWEALEQAGIRPSTLAGTDAGVFMGVGSDDYGRRLLEDLPQVEAWTGIGGSLCGVANRISYTFDLRGPSMAIDTACSASLVAIHLACQSLRLGESPVAIAGGVLVMAGPGLTVVLDAAGATAPDGRCKSFDASANGYGRGEGAGVIVLKRLSDALRDGNRVLALIRGSAVHQDGKTNGIMAPSQEAQEHLLRRACAVTGVAPRTIDYVEAHGTGTRMGDPIEAGALAAVFGRDRETGRPCLVGSVKPNIGHLEAGSGVASVIKTVLALRQATIPPNRNFSLPNPDIPWDRSGLQVVTEPTAWPQANHPRRAGVSGFGYGGTIAHLVLEQAPEQEPEGSQADGPEDGLAESAIFPISGASEAAVLDYAGRLADWLEGPGAAAPLRSVQHTLACSRSLLRHRAAVIAGDRAGLAASLRELSAGEAAPGAVSGHVLPGSANGLVWVFSGHGSQWAGMGRGLLADEPVFASVLDQLEVPFLEEIGFSPTQALLDGDLGGVDRIQPLIFAVQVGLAAVWQSHGVRPDAVIGHSVGEIAAAVTAGILGVEEGARLVCRRSRLLRRVAGRGAMILVYLPFDEVELRLAARPGADAAISASPIATVVVGDVAAVQAVAEEWQAEGLVVRRVESDVAFHSSHMDPLLDELVAAAATLRPAQPKIPAYTTALDDPRSTATRDGRYWAANLRQPVQFAAAIAAAAEDGYRTFIEVSSHPVVAHSIGETLAQLGVDDAYVGHTLRRNKPERETLLVNLAAMHCQGVAVDWAARCDDGELVDLPLVAWQHRSFWAGGGQRPQAQATQHDVESHNLLGGKIAINGTTPVTAWQTYLDMSCRPFPADHPVHGVEIVPAAVLLGTFFDAATRDGVRPALTDVHLRVPVAVTSPREVQVVNQDGVVRILSRLLDEEAGQDSDRSWLTHSTATAAPGIEVGGRQLPLADIRQRCEVPLDTGFVLERLASVGVAAMGFPWVVEELWRGEGELFAQVRVSDDPAEPPSTWACALDAALSIASTLSPGVPTLRMPAGVREVAIDGDSPGRVLISVRVTDAAADTVDVDIADERGRVAVRLTGLQYGMLEGDLSATTNPRQLTHQLVYRPLERPTPATAEPGALDLVVFAGDDTQLARELRAQFAAAGVRTLTVGAPEDLDTIQGELAAPSAVVVTPAATRPGETVSDAAVRSTWLLTRIAQHLTSAGTAHRARLWCLTTGVRDCGGEPALGQAPLWGLGRVISGEHPEIWGGIVDVAPGEAESGTVAGSLLGILRTPPGEDVIVLREGAELVARLAELDGPVAAKPRTELRPDGTYLITGGLGVLGLEIARWLALRGARRLVLASRHALPPRESWAESYDPETVRQIEAVRALEALGVTVRTVALDICDRDQASEVLSQAQLGLTPIRGIVHAAGVLDSRMVRDVDEQSLRTVMAPKVGGAWVLHELFPPGSLDFLVLFSSCGLLLGLTGQASYASGNAFLDALASHRRASGHADTVSFGWTSWQGLGMSTSSAVIDAELANRGTASISATDAFRCWEFADRYDRAYFAVLRTVPLEPGMPCLPLLCERSAADPQDELAAMADAEASWSGLHPDDLRGYLLDEVRGQVAAELKSTPAELDPRRPLAELGLDSVMSVVIRRRLERQFRLRLPATLLWECPTASAIAAYLAERLIGDLEDQADAASGQIQVAAT